ncbi:MAG TPA: type II toxin-antitoxin system RelE/ParE family toxin [Pirellulales bacterium]|nr:type II toxin-antitoxin system RelE/ParE family toxin [Pirellulales bacterium]
MARRAYALIFSPEVGDHLKAIDSKFHALILEKIDEQLQYEPTIETRNRKPLRTPAPFSAQWEIRFGPQNRFRVLYDVNDDEGQVNILAVGEKTRNRLLVGGEEIEL